MSTNKTINWRPWRHDGDTHAIDDGGLTYYASAPGWTARMLAAEFARTCDDEVDRVSVTDLATDETTTLDVLVVEVEDVAGADTDYTIGYRRGADDVRQPVAVAEEGGSGGYYAVVREGEYVHNPHDGFSWYVSGGKWKSIHGEPDGLAKRDPNDGDQDVFDVLVLERH